MTWLLVALTALWGAAELARVGHALQEPIRRRAAYAIAGQLVVLVLAGTARGTAWEVPVCAVAAVLLAGHAVQLRRAARPLARAAEDRAELLSAPYREMVARLAREQGGAHG